MKKAGVLRTPQQLTFNIMKFSPREYQIVLKILLLKNKRQVKHTSTVLEPSIAFQPLVKIADAEYKANDKVHMILL